MSYFKNNNENDRFVFFQKFKNFRNRKNYILNNKNRKRLKTNIKR